MRENRSRRSRVARHRVVGVAVGLAWAAGTANRVAAQVTNPVQPGTVRIGLTRVATIPTAGTGNGEPLDLTHAGDGSGRLFVATHGGQVRLVKNGALQPTSFLSVNTAPGVSLVGGSGNDERGLLGLAFHPDFAAAGSAGFGKFYTYTSESTAGGTADFTHPELGLAGGDNHAVVREWSVPSVASDTASTASRVVMRVVRPQSNHNGGAMRFGPDKNLYIGSGDGGGANDFSGGKDNAADGHTNVTGNGQDPTNLYGKILRIDPLAPSATPGSPNAASANGQYRIPAANPFAASATNAKEIYATGFRNPFRISFDRATGSLYAGDVGQGAREEVDVVTAGANYGWPYLEGTADNSNYAQAGAGTATPIAEYTHGDGISITGGYVYRGGSIPELVGKYVFGDLRGPTAGTGRLFYTDTPAGGTVRSFLFDATGVPITTNLYSIGEDQAGELYATFANGDVLKIVPEPGAAGLAVVAGLGMLGRRRRSLA